MALQQSPTGPVSASLGLVPSLDLETEEERRRKQSQMGKLTSRPAGGIVSNMILGGYGGS